MDRVKISCCHKEEHFVKSKKKRGAMFKTCFTNNPRELGERLWNFRGLEKFCDATISINQHCIPVHANVLASFSQYFEDEFGGTGNSPKKAIFTNVNLNATLSLIEYCYKGEIDINAKNALDILEMANIMKIESIVENCTKVLNENLNKENCVSIWKVTKCCTNEALKNHIASFIKNNIGEIYLSDEYMSLKYAEIKAIFSSEAKAKSDKILYDALKQWVNHDVSRKKYSNDLLEHIDLSCIPKDSINSSEALSICGSDAGCVLKFLNAAMSQGNVTDCSSFSDTLLVIGGISIEQSRIIEIYHLNEKKWIQINHREAEKIAYAAALVNDKIIVAGGNKNGYSKTAEYFDLRTGRTESLPQMNQIRNTASAITYENNVFVFGGFDGARVSSVEKWSPSTRTWTLVAPMSIARDRTGASILDDEIFIVGGYGLNNLSVTEAYNPTTDTWRKCKDMNVARHNPGVAAINGYLYAVGGRNTDFLNTAERYDKSIDEWTMIQSLGVKKFVIAAEILNGQLVITGGENNSGYLNTVEAYDEKNDKWVSLPSLNQKRGYHCAIRVPWSLAELALTGKY